MSKWFVKNKRLNIVKDNNMNTNNENGWMQCKNCEASFQINEWNKHLYVCNECEFHMYISPVERLDSILDEKSFIEINNHLSSYDMLSFSDTLPYSLRIEKAENSTKTKSAICTGTGTINKIPVAIGIMNFKFMGGSMGSVLGEKIVRLIEKAIIKKLPLIIFCSSGGARMQEGLFSLMQMSKTTAALANYKKTSQPYISVLTHPTTGGTTASFASLGDIIIAEPGALIGFAGPRVIEQTIRQKLPSGFQRSELLMEKGFVDIICSRKKMRKTIYNILKHLRNN